MKLFLMTFNRNSSKVHIVAESLSAIENTYGTDFKSIEVVDKKPMVLGGKKYDLLKEALDFIESGANTQSNEKRIELEDKIKQNLGI